MVQKASTLNQSVNFFKCGKPGHRQAECNSNRVGSCFNCGKLGHRQAECWSKNNSNLNSNNAEAPIAFFTSLNASVQRKSDIIQWYMDSGTTDHMIKSSEYLESLETLQSSLKVDDTNQQGVGLEAVSKGVVSCSINGRKIEFVKNLHHNLLFVSKLDKKGFYVMFGVLKY